jgi:hypothetical protein
MLQMHGEMMKAMGDIMMKHGRRMQGATNKRHDQGPDVSVRAAGVSRRSG